MEPVTNVEQFASHQFDTKIVVIIREDLETWQKLNATAFLASGIAGTEPEVIGEPYEDGSENHYLPMFRQPVLVFGATGSELRRAFGRARQREIDVALFTDDLFRTNHDLANRAAVKAVAEPDLSLVGIAFRSDRKEADKVVKGLKFHS
jgi:hypothetical protein